MDMDQVELDAAYDQSFYAPMIGQFSERFASSSDSRASGSARRKRFAYGPTPIEGLDVFPADTANAPIFVYVHGGAMASRQRQGLRLSCRSLRQCRRQLCRARFHRRSTRRNGDLRAMADQVRRGIAWVYKNAASFNGDTKRFYIGGHSSGGHLCRRRR